VLQLQVEDVAALFEMLQRAGATVVFPLMEFCGERMARVRDPFGHVWIISQRVGELTTEEIQRRRDAFVEKMIAERAVPSGSSKT
jgi:PhnB protein